MSYLTLCSLSPKPLEQCRNCSRNPLESAPSQVQNWMTPITSPAGCDQYIPINGDEQKVTSYSIETIKPGRRPAIWGQQGSAIFPLCYLQRPASLSDAQWQAVLGAIRLDAKQDFLAVADSNWIDEGEPS